MARARNIKPAFFMNEDLVELPFQDRLLFIGLWTLADREGRLEDRPKRIKMEIFPAGDVSVDESLTRLASTGMLVRYDKTIQINDWKWWQSDDPIKQRGSSSRKWRNAVLHRDGNQCVKCGARHRLEAHHILRWATHPEERFNVDNGVTLCTVCHREEHRRKEGV